jgi:hypothetical protein
VDRSEFDLVFFKATVQITHLGRSLFLFFWFRRSTLRELSLSLIAILTLYPSVVFVSVAENLSLTSDQTTSTAGYYHLSWQGNDGSDSIYIVEETSGDEETPRVIYKGADTATVISGKPDGIYTYKVKSEDSRHVSNLLTVTVEHHSLTSAFNFFWIGAIVFIFILIAILRGNKQRDDQS